MDASEIKNKFDFNIFENIINDIEVSINIFDKNGKRIFINPYYYRLSGRPKGSKISSDMSIGEDKKKAEYLTKKVLESIKTGKILKIKNFFYTNKRRKNKPRRYFNFLIGPIKDKEGTIIGAYTMVTDVTARFLARRKLMSLNSDLNKKVSERTRRLEMMSKEKNMLVSDVAHEIKTVLTIIKGNMEILQLDKKTRDPLEIECWKEIQNEIEKMSKIASDLVFIAKSEQYAETFKFENFNVARLIKELIKKYTLIAKDKIKIVFKSEFANQPVVLADKAKITTLICNLIENALKFSQEDTRLWITLKSENSMIHLSFRDNGVGIGKENIDFIFSPFFQVNKANAKNSKKIERGFGLGLAICKKIIDAHKGRIYAKSDGPGKGTTFHIDIPNVLNRQNSEYYK
jgi:signal transduction histidine kinase